MTQNDFHARFNTSTAMLHDAIAQHAHFKNLVEDAEERQAEALERIRTAAKEASKADERVQAQKDALITAVGTPNEAKTLSALQDARVEAQRAKDLHEALVAAYGEGPNLQREKKLIDQHYGKARAAAVAEELERLPDGTLEVLRRGFACYEGAFDWAQFLELIFPQQEGRLMGRLAAEVLRGHGLAE